MTAIKEAYVYLFTYQVKKELKQTFIFDQFNV